MDNKSQLIEYKSSELKTYVSVLWELEKETKFEYGKVFRIWHCKEYNIYLEEILNQWGEKLMRKYVMYLNEDKSKWEFTYLENKVADMILSRMTYA